MLGRGKPVRFHDLNRNIVLPRDFNAIVLRQHPLDNFFTASCIVHKIICCRCCARIAVNDLLVSLQRFLHHLLKQSRIAFLKKIEYAALSSATAQHAAAGQKRLVFIQALSMPVADRLKGCHVSISLSF